MNDKVSIIVPVFNVGKYLKQGIISLINQSYSNIEIILVDNGSTDESAKIIKSMAKKDRRIISIYEKNKGVSFARNAGLKVATGEYIMFVDGDDWVDSDYVSYFVDMIHKFDGKVAMNLSVYSIGKDNLTYKKPIAVPAEKAIEWIYSGKINVAVWNKIYKRSVLNELKFSNDIWFGEGMLFNIECLQRLDKVVIGSKKVYHQVFNPQSAMRNFNLLSNYCGISSLWLQRAKIKNMTPEIEKQWQYHLYRFNRSIIDGLVREKMEKEQKLIIKECIRNIRSNIWLAVKYEPRIIQKFVWLAYFICPLTISKVIARRHVAMVKKYS